MCRLWVTRIILHSFLIDVGCSLLHSAMVRGIPQRVRPCQRLWESDLYHLCLLGAEVLARKVDTKSPELGGGLALWEHMAYPEGWARVSQADKGMEGKEEDRVIGQHKGRQMCRDLHWGPIRVLGVRWTCKRVQISQRIKDVVDKRT